MNGRGIAEIKKQIEEQFERARQDVTRTKEDRLEILYQRVLKSLEPK
jgi:hypothetical protein